MLKIYDGERIEASEYDKHHVCFEVESKSCAQGQLVQIEGLIKFTDDQVAFSGSGKISRVQTQENAKIKVTIELRSHDKDIWNRFVDVLQNRQDHLDKLFASMKDDE